MLVISEGTTNVWPAPPPPQREAILVTPPHLDWITVSCTREIPPSANLHTNTNITIDTNRNHSTRQNISCEIPIQIYKWVEIETIFIICSRKRKSHISTTNEHHHHHHHHSFYHHSPPPYPHHHQYVAQCSWDSSLICSHSIIPGTQTQHHTINFKLSHYHIFTITYRAHFHTITPSLL